MATTIKWIDNNNIETAHRIYKSSTYFDKDSLPAVLVELGPDVTEWEDVDGVDGENWYIVSALLNDYEVFSEPFITGLSTPYIHDVFGDGSAVATYNFDGDATDLGGTYNGTWSSAESYVNGVIGEAADFTIGNASINTNFRLPLTGDFSVSFWMNSTSTSTQALLGQYISTSSSGRLLLRYGLSNEQLVIFIAGNTSSTLQVLQNTFNHIIFSRSDSVMYIKNVNTDTTVTLNVNPSLPIDDTNLILGERGTGTDYYEGFIDQVRIFNRTLTPEEIDILYQEGADFL